MTRLAPTQPLGRAELAEAFRIISEIDQAVEALPWGQAKAIKAGLKALRETIGESLPGNYFSDCKTCGCALGYGDHFTAVLLMTDLTMGDVLCSDCANPEQKDQTE